MRLAKHSDGRPDDSLISPLALRFSFPSLSRRLDLTKVHARQLLPWILPQKVHCTAAPPGGGSVESSPTQAPAAASLPTSWRRRPSGGVGVLHCRRGTGHQLVMEAPALTSTASSAPSTMAPHHLDGAPAMMAPVPATVATSQQHHQRWQPVPSPSSDPAAPAPRRQRRVLPSPIGRASSNLTGHVGSAASPGEHPLHPSRCSGEGSTGLGKGGDAGRCRDLSVCILPRHCPPSACILVVKYSLSQHIFFFHFSPFNPSCRLIIIHLFLQICWANECDSQQQQRYVVHFVLPDIS